MKKTDKLKKLKLNQETVKVLAPAPLGADKLAQVAGGEHNDTNHNTCSCVGCYGSDEC